MLAREASGRLRRFRDVRMIRTDWINWLNRIIWF